MAKYVATESFSGVLPGDIALTAVAGETVLDSVKDAAMLKAWGKFFTLVPEEKKEKPDADKDT